MKLNRHLTFAIAFGSLFYATGALSADDDWQLSMLHEPSAAQLKLEQRGRVFIYDGLDSADVERAMDTQFDRLDRMMFVRTRFETEAGDYGVEDDGCS